MGNDLYSILKDCFDSDSKMAVVELNHQNMISMKFKSKYIKKRNPSIISKELDYMVEDIFEDFEEKDYFDKVDNKYVHKDPNSKIIIFDTKNDVLMIHNHRFIIVKTVFGKNIELSDITINTREYDGINADGSIIYSKNPKLTATQKQKYLAFIIGACNVFRGYTTTPEMIEEKKLFKKKLISSRLELEKVNKYISIASNYLVR